MAGNDIVAEQIHTIIIRNVAFLQVILAGYVIGSVIAQYLSRLMTQRFKMEAVDAKTSKLCQPSHQSFPNIHWKYMQIIFHCVAHFGGDTISKKKSFIPNFGPLYEDISKIQVIWSIGSI